MRRFGLLAAAVGTVAAFPASAAADVTCDYSSAGKLLTVDVSAADGILRVVAGEIVVIRGINPVTCTGAGGPPTVTNTGAISVTGGEQGDVVIEGADDFVPGPDPQDGSDSAGGTKEIEFFVNLNDAAGSSLTVGTGDGGGVLFAGSNGINANFVGEAAPRDSDIFPLNVPELALRGGSGNDQLSADGESGSGTGGPLLRSVTIDGAGGADLIVGSPGADRLLGGPGADSVFGRLGSDTVLPGLGDDTANGGPGDDTVLLTQPGPVALDLAVTAGQATGEGDDAVDDFEGAAAGESSPATFRGDAGPNTLTGSAGSDTLEGRGGSDVLFGNDGADALDVRDGGPDTADCGDGADTVTTDALGVDLLIGCETPVFPPPPPPPSGGGGPAAVAAFGPKTLVRLSLVRKRIRPRGRLAVRIANANAFAINGRLSGRRLTPRSFTVGAGARKTVRLRLSKPLRQRLVRRRRLTLRLRAAVRDPAGNERTVRKRVAPRLKR